MELQKYNPDLPFIKPGWEGNNLNDKGLYTNLYGDDLKSLSEVIKWLRGPRPLTKLKKGQTSPLSWQRIINPNDKSKNALIPLGHASFIIDLHNIRLIIDPVVSPNRFLKRHTPVPFELSEIRNIDYLLLSHNHRDHIDKVSIQYLCKQNPEAVILTGLGIGKVLKNWGIKNTIQEAGWYQQYKTHPNLHIDYLPCQHWSRRWFTDTNLNLWGSFMIQDTLASKTIYFASDSGYGPHFSEIGKSYTIDLALIGIGAYEPQWFMNTAHTGPVEALKAFRDLQSKKWMPMHYGTFDLSDEPIFYPEKILREQHSEELPDIVWMNIGQRIVIP